MTRKKSLLLAGLALLKSKAKSTIDKGGVLVFAFWRDQDDKLKKDFVWIPGEDASKQVVAQAKRQKEGQRSHERDKPDS